jgi:hypothetical protein
VCDKALWKNIADVDSLLDGLQVTAGAGLAHALSSSLMELELHRKVAPSRYGSPPETLVGFAQVRERGMGRGVGWYLGSRS